MYFVTGPANADIDKYMQWQREQWGVNVATRWFNNLYARFDSLAAMPGQATECEWAPGLGWLMKINTAFTTSCFQD
jgi:plasmid stabilization system protein ParE